MTEDNDGSSVPETSSGAGNTTGGGPQPEQQAGRLEIGGQPVGLTAKGQNAFEVARTRGVGDNLIPQHVKNF